MGTIANNNSNNSNSNNSSNNSGFVTLPFGLGYTWFEEMDYKTTGQTLDINDTKRIHSLHHASENIDYLIDQLIHNDQGWIPERIFLLGFSAGAYLAMNVCYNQMQRGKRPLGGVICIAGGIKGVTNDLKLNTNDTNSNLNDINSNSTPLLLMGGSNDKIYSTTMFKADAKLYSQLSSCNSNNKKNNSTNSSRSKNDYDYDYNHDQDIVKIHIQPGKGHGMVNQKEEIQCMMQFFADNMVRRMIAMKGWSEVSSFSTLTQSDTGLRLGLD
jgi:predicted esterase